MEFPTRLDKSLPFNNISRAYWIYRHPTVSSIFNPSFLPVLFEFITFPLLRIATKYCPIDVRRQINISGKFFFSYKVCSLQFIRLYNNSRKTIMSSLPVIVITQFIIILIKFISCIALPKCFQTETKMVLFWVHSNEFTVYARRPAWNNFALNCIFWNNICARKAWW